MMKRPDFDPEIFYRPTDGALRSLATEKTLAKWRCERRGPAFHKISGKIYYRGSDLLAWFDAMPRFDPAAAA